MNDYWDLVAGAGGASVLIVGLSAWLGKLWANKILEEHKKLLTSEIEKEKFEYSKILEKERFKYSIEQDKLKQEYSKKLEEVKTFSVKYSEAQFNIYGVLWEALCDLQKAVNDVWDQPTKEKVRLFSNQLDNAMSNLNRASIYIDDSHLESINEALQKLYKIQEGKGELADKLGRGSQPLEYNSRLWSRVQDNRRLKSEFGGLLDSLRSYFKSKISGV
tara:strand:- start:9856 stop:10509 length:654 start_codon:yes stop_codon:yes gene_type:complete